MQEKRIIRGTMLTLIVATFAVTGCAARPYRPYLQSEPQTKGAFVLAKDLVLMDPTTLSKIKHRQELRWIAFPGITLRIKFDNPSLFPKIDCEKNQCNSGPIAHSAAYGPYPYHACVDVDDKECAPFAEKTASGDPTVIIEY